MRGAEYEEMIREAVDAAPMLSGVLSKILRVFDKRGADAKTITICANHPNPLRDLLRLFPLRALKEDAKKGRYILKLSALSESGFNMEEWLAAAAKITGYSPLEQEPSNEAEILVERLRFAFPGLNVAVDALSDSLSTVRRRITENGIVDALRFYENVLAAVDFLKRNEECLSPADLGAQVTGDSKSFKIGSAALMKTVELLAVELDITPDSALEHCGVFENPTAATVTVFGPFVYEKHCRRFDWIKRLWEIGEAATLNLTNLNDLNRIFLESETINRVVTSENESPFNSMMRVESGFALIYTAGFPNSAVRRFLSSLDDSIEIFHWGDTDPEGLRIANMLSEIRPTRLFRCDISECERLQTRLRPLSAAKLKRAGNLLESTEFTFRSELEFSMKNGWLEQEAWQIS